MGVVYLKYFKFLKTEKLIRIVVIKIIDIEFLVRLKLDSDKKNSGLYFSKISVVDLVKILGSQMNKTTVYRLLDKLKDDGIVHSFIGNGGLKWYAKCYNCSCETHNDIHPHFQCKMCGTVECLPASIALPAITGYKIESANMFMIGECCNCN